MDRTCKSRISRLPKFKEPREETVRMREVVRPKGTTSFSVV